MVDPIRLGRNEAEELATLACQAVGADEASTRSLVRATLAAEAAGRSVVGFSHLVDYLESFTEGRINRNPQPTRRRPFPAFIHADADRGVAQLGFDLAFDEFVDVARRLGVAVFSQQNSYSTGELGYYARRLAENGLVAFAASNASPVLTSSGNPTRVYGTNPFAFGFPMTAERGPIVIDQASSQTALVNVRAAATAGRPIPAGWAIGPDGESTTDPLRALAGALLPFGGRKGANIALMVEMLAAGISGANWSMDAADFSAGHQSPRLGLTVVAMRGDASPGNIERASEHADRLKGVGVYIPGTTEKVDRDFSIAADVYETLQEKIRLGPL